MSLTAPNDSVVYIIPAMVGATALQVGETGLVPYPSAGDQNKFLRGDGTWQSLPLYNGEISDGGNTPSGTYSNFLTSTNDPLITSDGDTFMVIDES